MWKPVAVSHRFSLCKRFSHLFDAKEGTMNPGNNTMKQTPTKTTFPAFWKKHVNPWIIFTLGALFLYNGLAFMIIAGVGMSPFDAFTKTFSEIAQIQYGTAGMIIGGTFFLVNLIWLNKKFPPRELAQVVIFIGGGFVMNFLTGTLYQGVAFDSFWINLVLFTLMTPVVAFGVLLIFEANLMTTPLESLCSTIAPRVHLTLGTVRWIADGIFLVTTLILILIFGLEWSLSYGTVIALALFGPLLDILKKPAAGFVRLLHLK